MNGRRRIASTATPVENSLTDLWCIVDFTRPGFLNSQKEFEQQYRHEPGEEIPEEQLTKLRHQIEDANLLLRRTKEEQLPNLPRRNETFAELPLSDQQLSLYGRYISIAADESHRTLGVLISLLMLSDHTALLTSGDLTAQSIDDLIVTSPKLKQTIQWLKIIQEKEEKVLIFTRFKRMQMILHLAIMHVFGEQYAPSILNGDIPGRRRQYILDNFKKIPGFGVLILSPDVAGMGLNIVEANHVIHYTRLWNPAKENQATDRVYRIGQTRSVPQISMNFWRYH